MGKIAPYEDFRVRASECMQVSKLDCQAGKGIFGGGLLLSEAATERKVEAERCHTYVWQLSEREKKIISELE